MSGKGNVWKNNQESYGRELDILQASSAPPIQDWVATAIYLFLRLGWIAARAHTGWIGPIGPPRKINNFLAFSQFSWSMEKKSSDGPKWGQEDFFPSNPDVADILGRTDLNFEIFLILGSQVSECPVPRISKFLDFQVPRSPNFWIPRSPVFQVPGFPGPQIPEAFLQPKLIVSWLAFQVVDSQTWLLALFMR